MEFGSSSYPTAQQLFTKSQCAQIEKTLNDMDRRSADASSQQHAGLSRAQSRAAPRGSDFQPKPKERWNPRCMALSTEWRVPLTSPQERTSFSVGFLSRKERLPLQFRSRTIHQSKQLSIGIDESFEWSERLESICSKSLF